MFATCLTLALVWSIATIDKKCEASPLRSRRFATSRQQAIGKVECFLEATTVKRVCKQKLVHAHPGKSWLLQGTTKTLRTTCVTKTVETKKLVYNATLDARMDSINFPSHVNVTKFHPLVTCTWTARTTPQSSSSRKSKPTATAAAALANAVKSYYVTIFKMDTEHANATASLCLRVDGKQKACSSGDGDDQVGLVLPVRDVSASNELNVSIVLMLTNAKDNGWGRARATGSYSVDSLTDPCKDPAPLPLERGMYYYNPTRRDCSRFRGEKSEAKSEKFHGTPFGSKNDCRKTCGVDSRPSSQIFARTQRMPTQKSVVRHI
ncbi:uncharacterized protein [Oscarella lobularis]|uniref:uncharacterized protein n=1 Tax=Oscarella lobularis TaxID=121494 RepID=UPI0033135239